MEEPRYIEQEAKPMQTNLFAGFSLPIPKHRIEYEFQELGIEMEKEFGKKIWPLFYEVKYTVPIIRRAWIAYQKQPIHSYKYFRGILKNTK